MVRGTELEPAARAAYERLTGHVMEPLVMVEGEYSASLDGMTVEGDLVLEIKCPMKGRESDLWLQVEAGVTPDYVAAQIEHQLGVTGASLAHLFVFDGQDGVLIEQKPQPERWTVIRRAWDDFMRFIDADCPPSLVQGDTRERDDPEWFEAAGRYLEARKLAEQAEQELEAAKKSLVALTRHPSERGAGVVVSRYFRRGAIDYRRIPALAGVDLDVFRGTGGEEVRVSVQK
jgi:predicted phage-related endonuclease